MASEWRPAAVAWGVVAFWLAVAVEVTSLVRPWIPHRVWRAIHTLGFVVWVGATVHLLEAGTDAGHPLFRAVQITVISSVLALFGFRVAERLRRSRRRTLPIEEAVHVDQVDAGKR